MAITVKRRAGSSKTSAGVKAEDTQDLAGPAKAVVSPSLKVNYRAIAMFCCQISQKIVFYYCAVGLHYNQVGYS
ncbi:hypothetical protein SCLCIDRAFT_436674 [Scleroderma citrinum Foug A]|uniref:Uncharacterized protein n=1 Tax=Scleroderma citrinum Foug A TaxID=1036808 RepID=A0A0C3CY08_9AGAM|nr:hypothetical protein SCLCIDRAFT_436674 [Scleroderma citrinum Foug A]